MDKFCFQTASNAVDCDPYLYPARCNHQGTQKSPIRIQQHHQVLAGTQDQAYFPNGLDGTRPTVPQKCTGIPHDQVYQAELTPFDVPRLHLHSSYIDDFDENLTTLHEWSTITEVHKNSLPDNSIQSQDLISFGLSPSCGGQIPENLDDTINDTIDSSYGFQYIHSCGGGLSGPHHCFREGKLLTILCLGGDTCFSVFTTRNDFNRHCNTVHIYARTGTRKLFDCPVVDCIRVGDKGFKRKDNLLQHRRLVHREDIPKVRARFGHARPKGQQLSTAAAPAVRTEFGEKV